MPVNRPIGVMQGRLLPKYKGRYQAHPKGYWPAEFPIAQKLGLGMIEFILDFEDAWENPLLSAGGVDEIRRASIETGIDIRSVCADYFMEAPLHADNPAAVHESQRVMARLIDTAQALGIDAIVIPCVDQSSLRGKGAEDRLLAGLTPLLKRADEGGVTLSLEADLAPEPFVRLLERLGSDAPVGVNYDTGNSASLGYDPAAEWAAYGPKVNDVHIKDRLLGGASIELGTGHADIPRVLREMAAYQFHGPVILQAYRDDEGLAIFQRQKNWLCALMEGET